MKKPPEIWGGNGYTGVEGPRGKHVWRMAGHTEQDETGIGAGAGLDPMEWRDKEGVHPEQKASLSVRGGTLLQIVIRNVTHEAVLSHQDCPMAEMEWG